MPEIANDPLPQAMIDAQALLIALSHHSIQVEPEYQTAATAYLDLSISLAALRFDPAPDAVASFRTDAATLIQALDDLSLSNFPEWDALSKALDRLEEELA